MYYSVSELIGIITITIDFMPEFVSRTRFVARGEGHLAIGSWLVRYRLMVVLYSIDG